MDWMPLSDWEPLGPWTVPWLVLWPLLIGWVWRWEERKHRKRMSRPIEERDRR